MKDNGFVLIRLCYLKTSLSNSGPSGISSKFLLDSDGVEGSEGLDSSFFAGAAGIGSSIFAGAAGLGSSFFAGAAGLGSSFSAGAAGLGSSFLDGAGFSDTGAPYTSKHSFTGFGTTPTPYLRLLAT